MLAKAVAHHTTAAFIRVVGSEFVQKYLGEVRPQQSTGYGDVKFLGDVVGTGHTNMCDTALGPSKAGRGLGRVAALPPTLRQRYSLVV